MNAIHYGHYEGGSEQAIVTLWNECLHHDPITMLRFRNMVLLDANFDPEGLRLAFEGERLVGAVYAVRRLLPMHGTELEPDNGWITVFFVAPDKRRQRIGSRLLKEACAFLRKQGRRNVFFSSYAPNYFTPGLDEASYPEGYAFLQKNSFDVMYSPVAMDVSLVRYETPGDVTDLKQRRQSEGYTFRLAENSDLAELIRFATDAFNPDWGRAIREGLLRGLPMASIHIARQNGRLVGFCMHGGYEGVIERFGPFGVDASQQGKGLGKILLHDCLANMKAQGLHGAWFLWTGETTTAGHLYKKLGFHITRRFHVCRKSL